jgi:hypothetical protein
MSLRDENITDFQQNQNLLNVGVIGLGEQSCDNLIPAIINSEKAVLIPPNPSPVTLIMI